jgi:subfamily B ATP-binding cassette protein MsbA
MKLFAKVLQVKGLFHKLGIKTTSFIVPALFSLAASLFEGISMGALIPLLNGLVSMNFGFIKEYGIFKFSAKMLPGLSEISNAAIFIFLLVVVFGTQVLRNVLQYASAVIASYQLRKIADGIRKNIFEHYLSFGKMFFDCNNVGYLYNVLVNYATIIIDNIRHTGSLLSAVFMFAVYIIIMFMISWKATLFVAILFPILNHISKSTIQKIKNTSEIYEVSLGEIRKKFQIYSHACRWSNYIRGRKMNMNISLG